MIEVRRSGKQGSLLITPIKGVHSKRKMEAGRRRSAIKNSAVQKMSCSELTIRKEEIGGHSNQL